MKKFAINCNFGGKMSPFTVYIGNPEGDHHPLQFQAEWLSKERGGTIPAEVMQSLAKLKEVADKNGVSFEELCTYALQSAFLDSENAKNNEKISTENSELSKQL